MTTQSTCPNCWQLLIELKWLQAKLEQAEAKIAALEAKVRRGQRLVAPFLGKNRYQAVARGGTQLTDLATRGGYSTAPMEPPKLLAPRCGTPHNPQTLNEYIHD